MPLGLGLGLSSNKMSRALYAHKLRTHTNKLKQQTNKIMSNLKGKWCLLKYRFFSHELHYLIGAIKDNASHRSGKKSNEFFTCLVCGHIGKGSFKYYVIKILTFFKPIHPVCNQRLLIKYTTFIL